MLFFCFAIGQGCSDKEKNNTPPPNPGGSGGEIEYWITKADQSTLLQKASTNLVFNSPSNGNYYVDIDTSKSMQTVDGFGYTFTGGSAYLINKMNDAERSALLNELFGKVQTLLASAI